MTDTMEELSELLHRLVREAVEAAAHENPAHLKMTDPGSHDLVSIAEAAKRLTVSRSTIYGLMGSGELPYVQVGGKRGITIEDLGDFVAQHRACGRRTGHGHHE